MAAEALEKMGEQLGHKVKVSGCEAGRKSAKHGFVSVGKKKNK